MAWNRAMYCVLLHIFGYRNRKQRFWLHVKFHPLIHFLLGKTSVGQDVNIGDGKQKDGHFMRKTYRYLTLRHSKWLWNEVRGNRSAATETEQGSRNDHYSFSSPSFTLLLLGVVGEMINTPSSVSEGKGKFYHRVWNEDDATAIRCLIEKMKPTAMKYLTMGCYFLRFWTCVCVGSKEIVSKSTILVISLYEWSRVEPKTAHNSYFKQKLPPNDYWN